MRINRLVDPSAGKFVLQRVRLNQGGYDRYGSYWGVGAPLYYYELDSYKDDIFGHIRACNREDAKERIRESVPGARFYR